jgi:hypothetical protein
MENRFTAKTPRRAKDNSREVILGAAIWAAPDDTDLGDSGASVMRWHSDYPAWPWHLLTCPIAKSMNHRPGNPFRFSWRLGGDLLP